MTSLSSTQHIVDPEVIQLNWWIRLVNATRVVNNADGMHWREEFFCSFDFSQFSFTTMSTSPGGRAR